MDRHRDKPSSLAQTACVPAPPEVRENRLQSSNTTGTSIVGCRSPTALTCERSVGLDKGRHFAFHADTIPPGLARSLVLRQWLHHCGGHALLQRKQGSAHRLASSRLCSDEVGVDGNRSSCLWRKRFALSASRCTSSKDGILSSHSRSVAVGPHRSM